MPIVRLFTSLAAFLFVLLLPGQGWATPAVACSSWTQWQAAFSCGGDPGNRNAYCEGIAPGEVQETCTVCADECVEGDDPPFTTGYTCYATHEETCTWDG
jgi:hypothetical protein